jgi:hypothetical protein
LLAAGGSDWDILQRITADITKLVITNGSPHRKEIGMIYQGVKDRASLPNGLNILTMRILECSPETLAAVC